MKTDLKRVRVLLLACVLLAALAGCSNSDQNSNTAGSNQGGGPVQVNNDAGNGEPETDGPEDTAPKVLVAYFSATNTTAGVAADIAESLGADIYAITPAEPYTSADLNYGNDSSRTSIEMNDPNSRPSIGSAAVEDMADYDVVFLGYPIWWGQAPHIIYTFLESYDFAGKTIVPFCTSASSGIGSSASNLHSLTTDATWLSGERFSGNVSHNTLVDWLNGLGLAISAE